MATSAQVSLAAGVAAVLAQNNNHVDDMDVVILNGAATAIQLGGPSVSATTGFNLAAGATLRVILARGDLVYGFSTTAATPVSVLTSP